MNRHVCPWWLGYLLASPLRRVRVNPAKIIRPYVREGMTVLEPGPGMGFFTLEIARGVGAKGRVVAVDLQQKMLDGLKRRAAKAGVLDCIDARLASAESMGLGDLGAAVDFTFAFATVHEMPSAAGFFAQVARASKAGASLLLAEPKGHVSDAELEGELKAARDSGFEMVNQLSIPGSRAMLLRKN